jgi:Xaa-Pro aminopeptidase
MQAQEPAERPKLHFRGLAHKIEKQGGPPMTPTQRLTALRRLMARNKIQAYIVPSSDPHQSEYVPDFWQRRKFLTGFSGSAGDAVVTPKKAGLWTDSRYWLRAEAEIDARAFTLFRAGQPGVPSWQEWLAMELRSGQAVGLDPRLLSHKDYILLKTQLEDHGLKLRPLGKNLVDEVWAERPAPPKGKVEVHGLDFAGESVASKLARLRKKITEAGAGAHILTQLDAIAWLFNIRGTDVAYNPVVIAYAIILPKRAYLFLDQSKLSPAVRKALPPEVKVLDYEAFGAVLNWLADRKSRVWLDDAAASHWVVGQLSGAERLIYKPSPVALFKAVKNETEIEGFRAAHVRDGAAMVRFLHWLEPAVKMGGVSELSAAAKCEEFRSAEKNYRGLSFETISSYGPHGPVVHYAVTPETDIPLKPEGLYLIDSGSQYPEATTDITRTVALGAPTEEQKEAFTRVLKGLIALSTTSFPRGTAGKQLDTISRLPLWEKGLNFIHGTGHGVGTFLYVHEGPQAVSYYRCIGVGFEPGMVTTIEPGLYPEGKFGLRTENIVLVVDDAERSTAGTTFYKFETLTVCPIDLRLVRKDMLAPAEIAWLNAYHARVLETLSPLLSGDEAAWLGKVTARL